MKLNINENQVLELLLNNQILLENIDKSDRDNFIDKNYYKILETSFKNKNYKQLAELLDNQQINKSFIQEIKTFTQLAELNYISKLPENNIISTFILEMNRQNFEDDKKLFFQKIIPLILQNKEEMKKFFAIKIGEAFSSIPKGQPIGLCILRVINENIDEMIKEDILPITLFNNQTKDTMAHCLHQYSFENSKIIIENFPDLNLALKDKNEVGHNAIDKLSSDLRERNVKLIEYLFIEKLDIQLYKNEFINYIIKSSNILKNKQTKPSIRERAFSSLEVLFNLPQLQTNNILKELVAQNLAKKCTPEIQYLWLSAKLPVKGEDLKRPKI